MALRRLGSSCVVLTCIASFKFNRSERPLETAVREYNRGLSTVALPSRVFFTLLETASRWNCSIADIAGWAAVGRLNIMTSLNYARCGDEIVAGIVTIPALDLTPLFRRCGSGLIEGRVHRIKPPGATDWQFITDPLQGITVSLADMMIRADEVMAFEEENDLIRRKSGGGGGSPEYDWDGMMVALIKRIHDYGLPATQAELIAEMQVWFAERSNGASIPDERGIRRRVTPVWRSLRQDVA
jgi:hypothetical protein